MSITPISQNEINQSKVASLPARPNASTAFGGAGYSSAQLKEAFDRLPMLAISKLNELLSALSKAPGEGSLADEILTAKTDNEGNPYTLSELFSHIIDGTLATYLLVGGKPLDVAISEIPSEMPNEIYVGSDGAEDEIPNGAVVQFVIEEEEEDATGSYQPIFSYFQSGVSLDVTSGMEYRAKSPITSCTFHFPSAPKDSFICSFEFDTSSTETIALSFLPMPYITGDDCAQGVFSPQNSKHYSLLFWYDGLRTQGIARGVSI